MFSYAHRLRQRGLINWQDFGFLFKISSSKKPPLTNQLFPSSANLKNDFIAARFSETISNILPNERKNVISHARGPRPSPRNATTGTITSTPTGTTIKRSCWTVAICHTWEQPGVVARSASVVMKAMRADDESVFLLRMRKNVCHSGEAGCEEYDPVRQWLELLQSSLAEKSTKNVHWHVRRADVSWIAQAKVFRRWGCILIFCLDVIQKEILSKIEFPSFNIHILRNVTFTLFTFIYKKYWHFKVSYTSYRSSSDRC